MSERDPCIQSLIKALSNIIVTEKPGVTISIYGSYATGLCLPYSDIDLVIDIGKNIELWESATILQSLEPVILKHTDICSSAEVIKASTMPVLKMVSSLDYKSLNIDITLKNSIHKGIECVDLVKGYLKQYTQLTVVLPPIKNMLKIAKLNNPYTGGLSSYALILMFVDLLQRTGCGEALKPSELLLNFLYSYGNAVYQFRIDPSPPFVKEKMEPKNYEVGMPNVPLIYDPLLSGNNVSKTAYKFPLIQVHRLSRSFLDPRTTMHLCKAVAVTSRIQTTNANLF